jgi:hypothetical protein
MKSLQADNTNRKTTSKKAFRAKRTHRVILPTYRVFDLLEGLFESFPHFRLMKLCNPLRCRQLFES